ncbi:MAG: hypothetical protein IT460_16495 [Planctomycetes bacterium]|nr:hypothetical protein [Planctomycetota bacterium]
MRVPSLFLIAIAASLAACGKDDAPGKAASGSGLPVATEPAAEEHEHKGRHGGELLELGEHEGHVEIVHEESTGTITAYVSDADMKPIAVEAPVINLTKGAVQVSMTPLSGSGPKTDAWKATHEGLKIEPLDGRIRVKIGDRTYQVSLEHEHK